MQGVPAHAKVEGDEKANALAKSATTEHSASLSADVQVKSGVKRLSLTHWAETYAAANEGKHARDKDKALPGPHTKSLYDRLTRPKAAILAQMRT